MTLDEQINDARLTEAAERIRCTAGLADVLSYIKDQSEQFRQCAGHHAEHNRGAEAVAIRAAEILERISADIKSANADISDPEHKRL